VQNLIHILANYKAHSLKEKKNLKRKKKDKDRNICEER
jgi:hypothetical protein